MSKNEKGGMLKLSEWSDTFGMYGDCHTFLDLQTRSLKQSLRAKPTNIDFLALTLSTRRSIKVFQVEKAYLAQMTEFVKSPKSRGGLVLLEHPPSSAESQRYNVEIEGITPNQNKEKA